MTDFNIDVAELKKLAGDLEDLEWIIEDEVYLTMQIALATFHQAVAVETPVNTGALRGSLTQEIDGESLSLTGKIATPVLYGKYVEYGRLPGKMPPVGAIEYWVIRKLKIVPPESRTVAFLIARHIGQHGTWLNKGQGVRGARMFQRGFLAAKDKVLSYWHGLSDRVIRRLGR